MLLTSFPDANIFNIFSGGLLLPRHTVLWIESKLYWNTGRRAEREPEREREHCLLIRCGPDHHAFPAHQVGYHYLILYFYLWRWRWRWRWPIFCVFIEGRWRKWVKSLHKVLKSTMFIYLTTCTSHFLSPFLVSLHIFLSPLPFSLSLYLSLYCRKADKRRKWVKSLHRVLNKHDVRALVSHKVGTVGMVRILHFSGIYSASRKLDWTPGLFPYVKISSETHVLLLRWTVATCESMKVKISCLKIKVWCFYS